MLKDEQVITPSLSGITAIRNDGDYASFIFYAYGANSLISLYVDHDGQGIEDWFGSEIEDEEDGDDSCINGGKNEDEIDNLRDVEVDFNDDVVIMNKTKGDEFLSKLCGEEEEGNDNNIGDNADGGEEEANGGVEVNEGDVVNEGDKAVSEGGQAVNEGGDNVNVTEMHVQQDYDEVELTTLEFDESGNGEPIEVHVQQQEVMERPIATLLKKIGRKKSERFIKLKLGKRVGGEDASGSSISKALTLD
ncbi:unnamed protein product [Lactuca virosa]|uniref:Uncharacterized protein n=1 Tax=Lactuca virosa TaxID=75947 RepID=A0AAU9MB32_9ASTR|nr:unnamed protein product [Lactuca virosa]